MQSTPDACGRGQLVKDGGDATILLHEGTGLESTLGNDGISPDPENSVNTVFKRVMQWVKASISLLANQRLQIRDHKKKTISDAIYGKIGHIGNEFGMTSRREGGTGWCHDDVDHYCQFECSLEREGRICETRFVVLRRSLFFGCE